jgi:hypothetical protein
MTDGYTKIVLTIIAATLAGLVGQNAIRPSGAQGGVQKVLICDADNPTICASVRANVLLGEGYQSKANMLPTLALPIR